ncbi:MAG: M15 family metallopeptidase [Treponema sp.]|nr:M15 family metallopeptidase [Treponema sp.]
MLFTVLLLILFLGTPVFAQHNPGGRNVNGELVLRALQKSFPHKIDAVSFIDNDWTISAGGETFFWAGGRLLPKAEKDNVDSYSPHMFYMIAPKLASPDTFPPQYIETIRQRGNSEARRERRDSHRAFQGILYGGLKRTEIEALIDQVDFLGTKISVHHEIVEALRRVEAAIKKMDDAQAFIDSIGSIGGYSWREIAGTQRMSYHSWGLAIDIQPKRLGGKAIYWLWEQQRNKDNWMLVPLKDRWIPPLPVIEAFEKEGFVWGGKWPFYDNMHFEYRPELHEFTRLMAADPIVSGNGRDLHHVHPTAMPLLPRQRD